MNLPAAWGVYQSKQHRAPSNQRGHQQRQRGTTEREQQVHRHMRTAVIVIGDPGRSPRMQYHAVSLADAGSEVDLIGLEGATLIPAIASHPRITCIACPIVRFRAGERRHQAASYSARLVRAVRQASRWAMALMRIAES